MIDNRNSPMKEERPGSRIGAIQSPAGIFAIVAASAFVIEVALMYVFNWLPSLSVNVKNALDGVLLTFVLSPILYLFQFRPLRNYIAALTDADALLQKQRDHLEEEVCERTAELAKAKDDLEASFREIDDLYQNAPCGYHSLDRDGRFLRINETELKMLGYAREELVGRKRMCDLLTTKCRAEFDVSFFGNSGSEQELEFVRKDGSIIPVLVHSGAILDESGQFAMSRSTIFDITERKKSERLLEESERRFRHIMEHAPIGIAITNQEGRFLQVNRVYCDIVGLSKEEIEKLTFNDITHPDDREISSESHRSLLGGKGVARLEKRYIHKDGHQVWAQVTTSLERDESGGPLYFIGMVEDISERKLAEERIRFLAYHDPLTGLPNRELFSDRLHRSMAQAGRKKKMFALLFMDLDKFKAVNDTFGHEAGDNVLETVSDRLKACVRDADTVARLGGDEFAVILDEIEDPLAVAPVAAKIIQKLSEPVELKDGRSCSVGVSIGIAIYPNHAGDFDSLMTAADEGMYESKRRGTGAYTCFGAA